MSRYEVVSQDVGAGGFGRIHKARDTILERDVAIKILDPIFKIGPSEDDKERFRREAKTLASLSHPSVPAIYDVVFDTDELKIIFEWIEGIHMLRYIQDHGPLTVEQSRRWFGHICSALEHAHNAGIIHRDIKPANLILASASEVCYVVDFGISLRKHEAERLTSSTGIGTPGYMSPEQERGDDLHPASDIFSLAVVLYECLSGTKPAVGHYTPLHTLNEAIPPSVDSLIQTCLRESPDERSRSAKDFFEQLERALEPHSTFADTLTRGTLYEIMTFLRAMSPVSFSQLPRGQRLAVLTRIKDLIRVDEDRMQKAVATLLATLIRVAPSSNPEDYRFIIQQSIIYGYEKEYSQRWIGSPDIREKLNDIAPKAASDAHAIISHALLDYLNKVSMDGRGRWWFHDLRILLQNLLANPTCDDEIAERLAVILDQINQQTH